MNRERLIHEIKYVVKSKLPQIFLAGLFLTSVSPCPEQTAEWSGIYFNNEQEKVFSGSLDSNEELVCPPTYRERVWVFGGIVGEKEPSFIRIVYRDWQLKPDTCKITTHL